MAVRIIGLLSAEKLLERPISIVHNGRRARTVKGKPRRGGGHREARHSRKKHSRLDLGDMLNAPLRNLKDLGCFVGIGRGSNADCLTVRGSSEGPIRPANTMQTMDVVWVL
jgi:hypothetical protein